MNTRALAALTLLLASGIYSVVGCSDDTAVHENPPAPDAGSSSSSSGASSSSSGASSSSSGSSGDSGTDCFTNPQTHVEIINACTDSQKFDKNPVLPLLLADGGLPPLP
jgi:hypothetical protein